MHKESTNVSDVVTAGELVDPGDCRMHKHSSNYCRGRNLGAASRVGK